MRQTLGDGASPAGDPLVLAVQAHRAGRLAEAARGYQAVLAARPDQADARHLLGVTLRQAGRPAAAAALIAEALALAPGLAEAYLNRGLALAGLRRFAGAAASYGRAARLDPALTIAAALRRGPLGGLTGWTLHETDDDILCVAPGQPVNAGRAAALRARLNAMPDADAVVFAAAHAGTPGDGPDDDGAPCVAGVWLARQLTQPGGLCPPVMAVLRRRFIDSVLSAAPPPDGAPAWGPTAIWGLVAAAARVAFMADPVAPPAAAGMDDGADDGESAAAGWLRRHLGRVVAAPLTGRLLRRALAVRLAVRLDDGQLATADPSVRIMARALRSLPRPGMIRMARGLARLIPAAAAVAIAAAAAPPALRRIHGLSRGGRGLVPLYAFDAGLVPETAWDGWFYIGQDPNRMNALAEGALRGVPRLPAEAALTQTALRCRAAFQTAWGGLLDGRPNRWAIMTAEQSPETATLFLSVCGALTALDLFRRADPPPAAAGPRLLVVVEQPALFHVIVDNLAPDPAARPWPDLEAELSAELWRHLRGFTREARRWRRHFAALTAARAAPADQPPVTVGEDADVLLVSYLDAQCFDAAGTWRDRYFGALPGWLRDRGLSVRWLWFDWTRSLPPAAYARLRQAPGQLYQELAGWDGVVGAMLEKINAWRAGPRMGLTIDGRDMTALLRMELRWSMTIAADIDRLLFRRAGAALARRGARIDRIIFPYENQGWEKMLCAGVRCALPDARLTGYVHASFSPFHLGYYPPASYWRSARRPHRVVALSPGVAGHLRANGYPADAVADAGALRYDYLFDQAPPPPSAAQAVLAVFPVSPPDALEMYRLLLQALGDRPDRPVRLKLHPATTHRVAPLLRGMPAHFQLIGGNMRDALSDCAAAIYTAGTTGLEILAAGVPVVSLSQTGRLPYLALPAGGPLTYAETAAAVRAAVDHYIGLGPAERRLQAAQARALALWWFAPPAPDQLPAFLDG